MAVRPRTYLMFAAVLLVLATLASTAPGFATAQPSPTGQVEKAAGDLVPTTDLAMTFASGTVTPAVGVLQDLYEPTVTVSGTGAIYVAGHVIGAYSTGTPAYVSNNNGVSWTQLPAVSSVSTAPVQGSAQPGGDEGIVVADGTGRAWLVDMGAQGMSVTGYCGNGANVCYTLPDAWSPNQSVASGCGVASVATDRPWAAYANNQLLLVNNGYLGTAGNRVQLSLLNVAPGVAPPVTPPFWNGCASAAGFIPGVPALRGSDGRYVIPHVQGANLRVITGTTLVPSATTTDFAVASTDLACPGSGYGANWGFSTVSQPGTFYVTAAKDATHFSVSATTTGTTFKTGTFATVAGNIAFLWISGSQLAEGALVSWAEDNGSCFNPTFYAAHIKLDATGTPVISDITTIGAVNGACGDLMGSSLSPSGNAYVVVFAQPNGCTDFPLVTPLRVYKQTAGPIL
ncbi:MAG: hypothetical protein V4510_01865 [bacterium]